MASTLTQWSLAAETKEWVGPITVLVDDDPVTGFEIALTEPGARPTTWSSPTALDEGQGALVGVGTSFPLVPFKIYTLWVRYTDSPEVPVQKCGEIKVY
jgi:hypothetical protein